jgi:hypothetical protein
MAQSALTVTPENPTPPTNMSSIGQTPPNPKNYLAAVYGPPPTSPPFFDDGVTNTPPLMSLNETGGVNGTTPPAPIGTVTAFSAAHALVADTTGQTSVAPEGAGTEIVFTQTYNPNVLAPIPLKTVGTGPVATAASILAGPNQSHASSLSPATNPTLASIAPTTSVHGSAAITLTATGVGFNPQSKIVIGGVPQATTFVSSTSLTCLATPPAAAGTPAVTVVTGGVVTTAPQTWTIT